MEEIIKSKILEYEKSSFLIDLIKHKSGSRFVRIKQNINDNILEYEININASILSDMIFVLSNYLKEIEKYKHIKSKNYFSSDNQKSVIERYFKGVAIPDLALQFDCSQDIIEQILNNNEIEIVDNKVPKRKRRYLNK